MAKLYEVGNIAIYVYANDHLPPHFHVITPDREAKVLITDLTVYRGELRASDRRRVWGWVEANVAAVAAEGNRVNRRFPIA